MNISSLAEITWDMHLFALSDKSLYLEFAIGSNFEQYHFQIDISSSVNIDRGFVLQDKIKFSFIGLLNSKQ